MRYQGHHFWLSGPSFLSFQMIFPWEGAQYFSCPKWKKKDVSIVTVTPEDMMEHEAQGKEDGEMEEDVWRRHS